MNQPNFSEVSLVALLESGWKVGSKQAVRTASGAIRGHNLKLYKKELVGVTITRFVSPTKDGRGN